MKDFGQISGGSLSLGGNVPNAAGIMRMNDSSVASGQAKLISELEKRDPLLREPLTSVTYHRDIPITTGGGWVDAISAMYVNYGVSEGSGEGVAAASGANTSKIIQADVSDERWGAHVFDVTMRVGVIDMHRSKITGRNIDTIYQEGIRLTYDKHMDQNTYVGMEKFGTYGLMNSPNVPARLVAANGSGFTEWSKKDPDEILFDINQGIIQNWNRAENDLSALPNHILLPYEQYSYIATTKVSLAADKTILTFIEENNIAGKYNGNLFIGATGYCKGYGTGGTDRMVIYTHDKKYLKLEELVALHRAMTATNAEKHSYDSLYLANISQPEMFYEYETIGYYDGI